MHSATPSTRRGLAGGEADQVELRDPRRENTVQNLELSAHEMRANSKELAEEEFATLTPTRVEAVELDQLYLCELEAPEHGLRLGLGMPLKEGPNNEEGMRTWTVAWFKISSKKGWKTKNITFEPHKIRGRHQPTTWISAPSACASTTKTSPSRDWQTRTRTLSSQGASQTEFLPLRAVRDWMSTKLKMNSIQRRQTMKQMKKRRSATRLMKKEMMMMRVTGMMKKRATEMVAQVLKKRERWEMTEKKREERQMQPRRECPTHSPCLPDA